MRTILSIAALVTTFHPTTEACGVPQLELHPVALYVAEHSRSFVVLGETSEVSGEWLRIAPHSYDYASFAELAPDKARTLTLVGAQSSTVVTATHRVALRGGWQLGMNQTAHVALEVPAGEFEVALDGKVDDAKWHELEYDHSPVQVTDIGLAVRNTGNVFEISRDGTIVRTGKGRVRGFLDAYGERFIVVDNDRQPRAIFFGAAI